MTIYASNEGIQRVKEQSVGKNGVCKKERSLTNQTRKHRFDEAWADDDDSRLACAFWGVVCFVASGACLALSLIAAVALPIKMGFVSESQLQLQGTPPVYLAVLGTVMCMTGVLLTGRGKGQSHGELRKMAAGWFLVVNGAVAIPAYLLISLAIVRFNHLPTIVTVVLFALIIGAVTVAGLMHAVFKRSSDALYSHAINVQAPTSIAFTAIVFAMSGSC